MGKIMLFLIKKEEEDTYHNALLNILGNLELLERTGVFNTYGPFTKEILQDELRTAIVEETEFLNAYEKYIILDGAINTEAVRQFIRDVSKHQINAFLKIIDKTIDAVNKLSTIERQKRLGDNNFAVLLHVSMQLRAESRIFDHKMDLISSPDIINNIIENIQDYYIVPIMAYL